MELYQQIIASFLNTHNAQITFPDLEMSSKEIVELESYKALHKIKEVIADTSHNDSECFAKIEEIIRIFEEMGSDCGSRHDFG